MLSIEHEMDHTIPHLPQHQVSAILQEVQLSNSPMMLQFVAAGTASAVASGLFNPLDCLRVRWQMQRNGSHVVSLKEFTLQILHNEGLMLGLWRPGIFPNMAGMAIASGIRFTSYETIRNSLVEEEKKGWHMMTSGLVCGAFAYFVTTPFHLAKTRVQAQAGKSSGLTGHVFENYSLRRVWRGSLPLAVRGSFFTAGQMIGYDGLKTYAKHRGFEDGPALHAISSLSASFCASFLSAPADYTMARVMNEKKGLRDCISEIYCEGGIRGFWKGWGIFFVRLTPVMLTYSTVYEQLRFGFGLGFMD